MGLRAARVPQVKMKAGPRNQFRRHKHPRLARAGGVVVWAACRPARRNPFEDRAELAMQRCVHLAAPVIPNTTARIVGIHSLATDIVARPLDRTARFAITRAAAAGLSSNSTSPTLLESRMSVNRITLPDIILDRRIEEGVGHRATRGDRVEE